MRYVLAGVLMLALVPTFTMAQAQSSDDGAVGSARTSRILRSGSTRWSGAPPWTASASGGLPVRGTLDPSVHTGPLRRDDVAERPGEHDLLLRRHRAAAEQPERRQPVHRPALRRLPVLHQQPDVQPAQGVYGDVPGGDAAAAHGVADAGRVRQGLRRQQLDDVHEPVASLDVGRRSGERLVRWPAGDVQGVGRLDRRAGVQRSGQHLEHRRDHFDGCRTRTSCGSSAPTSTGRTSAGCRCTSRSAGAPPPVGRR